MTEQTKNINNEEFMDEMTTTDIPEADKAPENVEEPQIKFKDWLGQRVRNGKKKAKKFMKSKSGVALTALTGGIAIVGGTMLASKYLTDRDSLDVDYSEDIIDVTDTAVETTDSSDANVSQENNESETEA